MCILLNHFICDSLKSLLVRLLDLCCPFLGSCILPSAINRHQTKRFTIVIQVFISSNPPKKMKKQSDFQSLSIGLNVLPSAPPQVDTNLENHSHSTFKLVFMYLLRHEFFQAADALLMSYTDGLSDEYVHELLREGLPLILHQSSVTRRIPQVVYDACSVIHCVTISVRAKHVGCAITKIDELLRKKIHYLSPVAGVVQDVFPKIYFRLLCQYFVDLIKTKKINDALDVAKTFMTPFEVRHTGKNDTVREYLEMVLYSNLNTFPKQELLQESRREILATDIKNTLIAFVFLSSNGKISDPELSFSLEESSSRFTTVMQKLWNENDVSSWKSKIFQDMNGTNENELKDKKKIRSLDFNCKPCQVMATWELNNENNMESTPNSSTIVDTTEDEEDLGLA